MRDHYIPKSTSCIAQTITFTSLPQSGTQYLALWCNTRHSTLQWSTQMLLFPHCLVESLSIDHGVEHSQSGQPLHERLIQKKFAKDQWVCPRSLLWANQKNNRGPMTRVWSHLSHLLLMSFSLAVQFRSVSRLDQLCKLFINTLFPHIQHIPQIRCTPCFWKAEWKQRKSFLESLWWEGKR